MIVTFRKNINLKECRMKKVILSIVAVLVVCCNTNTISAQKVSTTGAKIEFKSDVHDYGTIRHGGDGSCSFEFKNTGTTPLIISNAVGSCGCTVPSWPKEPIAPGATGKIDVKYDTQRAGEINKSVTITSNAVNFPNKVISIKGTVSAKPETETVPINRVGPIEK